MSSSPRSSRTTRTPSRTSSSRPPGSSGAAPTCSGACGRSVSAKAPDQTSGSAVQAIVASTLVTDSRNAPSRGPEEVRGAVDRAGDRVGRGEQLRAVHQRREDRGPRGLEHGGEHGDQHEQPEHDGRRRVGGDGGGDAEREHRTPAVAGRHDALARMAVCKRRRERGDHGAGRHAQEAREADELRAARLVGPDRARDDEGHPAEHRAEHRVLEPAQRAVAQHRAEGGLLPHGAHRHRHSATRPQSVPAPGAPGAAASLAIAVARRAHTVRPPARTSPGHRGEGAEMSEDKQRRTSSRRPRATGSRWTPSAPPPGRSSPWRARGA